MQRVPRSSARSSSRILVVEDDVDFRKIVVEVLEQEGFRVHEAENGAEALARLRSPGKRTDLILLDLGMPVMDGEDFRHWQRQDPRLASIPVLVLSADLHARRKAAALGVSGFLSKPFELEQLVATVKRLLLPAEVKDAGALDQAPLAYR